MILPILVTRVRSLVPILGTNEQLVFRIEIISYIVVNALQDIRLKGTILNQCRNMLQIICQLFKIHLVAFTLCFLGRSQWSPDNSVMIPIFVFSIGHVNLSYITRLVFLYYTLAICLLIRRPMERVVF